MKKTMGIMLGFITLAVATPALAQQDAAAKKILTEVSKKYDSYQTVQANFSFSAIQGSNKSAYTDAGTLYLDKKNNRYHITMNSQEMISDAKSLYTILKEEKEVQIAAIENSTDAIDPSNIFSFYKTGFKYNLVANEKSGNTLLNVVHLTPTDSKKNYSKIKLRINRATKLIYDATIYDKNGGQYSYTIKSQVPNKNLDNSLFSFNKSKYSGYEIVDLR
ncbi:MULTISPECIES: LolA family protein [Sphingobacterium]|uniref:Outer membrane lipoprotein carrier protein LolA n=1 Tax=Sphingobacterium kitahiroshimense TaxID=470446 RepID=A0ABV0BUY8_9SPHI|nr:MULTISPECIES: outer membrane lipoprotein carrier protein LolA [Sphingobacterium]MCS3554745.1 outer membrane lipoprotein-sorting protein [Sphingobacterium sp. JUb21]MCW2262661.1 outer membrane lipoprotein-sorting protein [Sphingobacterium kitahiroshimense]QQD15946.1 outer membrane lipoprotein carrier protein LolA [Sphingobacterium sp. UDSM-2020]TCR12346.1 outer membrane lipoprotein-sorting protein [Sphingobacterium sp. JUb78]